jgi:hypothetical protein
MMPRIKKIRIGSPGKFDEVFGLTAHKHPALMDPLWCIVWLDTGEQVPMTGGFMNDIQAEDYVKQHRDKMINRQIENELLT